MTRISKYLVTTFLTGISVLAFSATTVAADLDDPLVAAGKILYEETAGDVGCAMCHGMDATGDVDAGGTYIRGISDSVFKAALDGAVPVMEFIELTKPEKAAAYAYLQYLYSYTAPEPIVDLAAFPGKLVFEETAGGVGCQSCHGEDAKGDLGPDIRGRTVSDIRNALDSVEDMGFIDLTNQEIDDVSSYLGYLFEASTN